MKIGTADVQDAAIQSPVDLVTVATINNPSSEFTPILLVGLWFSRFDGLLTIWKNLAARGCLNDFDIQNFFICTFLLGVLRNLMGFFRLFRKI